MERFSFEPRKTSLSDLIDRKEKKKEIIRLFRLIILLFFDQAISLIYVARFKIDFDRWKEEENREGKKGGGRRG